MLDKKKLGLFYYLYDWANSPFSTVVITFIFSSYFVNSVANDKIEGTALWGWTIAISGLFLTILAPVMGYFGDYKKNLSSNFLFFSTFIVVILSSCLWFSQPSASYVFYTLMLVLASNTVYEMGQVFYNSELLKFKKQIPLGEFSGKAWASGYLGGIACLSIILFLVIIPDNNFLNLSKENFEHVRICGPVVGLWFLFFSIPFLISIKKINKSKITVKHSNFFESIKVALKDKNKINFLIARMIYTDGLITLFSFGGIYASGTFNFNFNEIIIFGILINISAAIGAYFLGFLEDRIGMKKVILISLFSLIIICFIILLIDEKILFWILGVSSGFFIGSIQSSSRTALIKISKQSELKKMFGLYAVSGKATNFLGPFLVASITTLFNSQRVGMSAILIFLILGALLLTRTKIE